MSHTGLSRHESYNNRFRTSSSGGGGGDDRPTTAPQSPQSPSAAITTTDRAQLPSVSENMEGASFNFGHLAFQDGQFQRMSSYEQPLSPLDLPASPSASGETGKYEIVAGSGPLHHYAPVRQNSGAADSSDPSRPMAPGMPRRLSRQMSADARRQQFAASRASSGEGGGSKRIVTSADSTCIDEVFVEMGGRAGAGGGAGDDGGVGSPTTRAKVPLYDSSLFPSKKKQAEVTFSVSSTSSSMASMLHNNPYNRVNHRVHDFVWCCSCLYFVFFCCLPAVHYMEQCDVEFNRNNTKRARTLGRLSTVFYIIGTLVALTLCGLIFFLAIFFTVY